MPSNFIKFLILSVGLGLIGIDLFWKVSPIDTTTVLLLLVAFSPWLLPLLKSIELPGGIKLEVKDFEDAEQRADEAGLLEDAADYQDSQEFSFQIVAREDPNLALAGLRIEIEKRLYDLAKAAKIGRVRRGVGHLLEQLREEELLDKMQSSVLADLVRLLNSAAHGADVDDQAAKIALEVGPRLLGSLDRRIANVSPP